VSKQAQLEANLMRLNQQCALCLSADCFHL